MSLQRNKTLFTIQIDNVVDIITNSSSELFVLKGEEKSIVEEMVANVYPDYKSEYRELKALSDIDNDELGTYLQYAVQDWDFSNKRYPRGSPNTSIAERFDLPFEKAYIEWANRGDKKYYWCELTEWALNEIRKQLPKNLYFLFSIGENPNWEYQESLSGIGKRYHLG